MIQIAMTPAQFQAAAAHMKAQHGVSLSGNEGAVSVHGASADYVYDGKTLSVSVTHTPFPFSKSAAETWLHNQLAA